MKNWTAITTETEINVWAEVSNILACAIEFMPETVDFHATTPRLIRSMGTQVFASENGIQKAIDLYGNSQGRGATPREFMLSALRNAKAKAEFRATQNPVPKW